jgi:hypothetical protein
MQNPENKITKITHENILRKAIALDVNNFEAWKQLFSILIKEFNFQEIIFLARKAYELNPDRNDLQKLFFHALFHALRIDEANK